MEVEAVSWVCVVTDKVSGHRGSYPTPLKLLSGALAPPLSLPSWTDVIISTYRLPSDQPSTDAFGTVQTFLNLFFNISLHNFFCISEPDLEGMLTFNR